MGGGIHGASVPAKKKCRSLGIGSTWSHSDKTNLREYYGRVWANVSVLHDFLGLSYTFGVNQIIFRPFLGRKQDIPRKKFSEEVLHTRVIVRHVLLPHFLWIVACSFFFVLCNQRLAKIDDVQKWHGTIHSSPVFGMVNFQVSAFHP